LVVLWGLPMLYFAQMPDRIPVHFDGGGNPDRWGSRNELWVIPAIGLGMCALFSAMSRYPHHFSYLVKITEENAAYQYRLSVRMLRFVKISVLLIMVYASWSIIQATMADNAKLPGFFMPIVVVVSSAPMLWYFWRSGRKAAP
ncbi:MAG: DUF1648 domain-containing protein, partial [Saprospiraceae bacterium]